MNPIHRARPSRRGLSVLEIVLAILLAPAFLYFAVRKVTGASGLAFIADDQVAVVVDNLSGDSRLVTAPGYQTFLPWLQDVYAFDKAPNGFLMAGNKHIEANHVPRLIARAKDGSSFWFDEFKLQYALVPERAGRVLEDCGPGDAFKAELVRAAARSILRDEFGRWSSEEVVRGECLQPATQAALARMNAVLLAHGIEVLEISTPRPGFDKAYEDAIGRRKVFNQEVEHLRGQLDRLVQEKLQREALARKEKEIELKKLEGNLVRDIGAAQKEEIRARQDADIFHLEKVGAARAMKIEKEGQAALLTAKYVGLARGVYKETLELERSGDLPVRSALVQKLAGIEFNLVPYSRDPSPQRLEYETVTSGSKSKP